MLSTADQLANIVMTRCDAVASCTEEPGRVTRRFLSEPMRQVHRLASEWMLQANLEPRVDHAGNLIGRRVCSGSDDRDRSRVLLVGSHLDTVPGAGRYDGVLGVLIGLAAADALRTTPLPFDLDVIGFSEEEGVRYSLPYIGSSAIAGQFRREWLSRFDADGISMYHAIEQFNLDPKRIDESAYDPGQVIGYIEPHLEQGPILEREGMAVGVVSGIVGQSRLRVEFVGEAAHAGTTPMQGRRDALVCAAELIRTTRNIGHKTEGLRATVGRLNVVPNAPNVVPRRVELSLDVRHVNDAVRATAINQLLEAADQIAAVDGVTFVVIEQYTQPSVAVDGMLSAVLADSIAQVGASPLKLVSGAGHDAAVMAKRFPTAMMFVRHPGGVSHHPDERVDAKDVATAIEVLTNFIVRIAKKASPTQ